MGGALQVNNPARETTFGAAIGYTHPAGDYAALSLTYLNEGHPDDHHRDGVAAQAWLRTHATEQGLTLAAGAGRYFYFDTSSLPTADEGYDNDHGWAPIYSLQAAWHFSNRWYAQVQLNRVIPHGKEGTTSLLVGAGYRFGGVRGDKLHLDGPSTDDTLTLLAGQTILNSFRSERATAGALEYRRAVGHYIDWTVTALNEGSSPQGARSGVATQLWLIRSLNQKVELGMGAGPYGAARVPDGPGARSHWSGLLSIASRYHFTKRIVGQVSWNRVATDYHRDTDVLLMGLVFSY